MHGVGVVIHDKGCVTTQLHRYPLELGGTGLRQMLAYRGGAGKRQLADRGMGAKHLSDRLWVTSGDQIGNWMGRAGVPSEMVGAALFLASDACSFMTGETVNITGGV